MNYITYFDCKNETNSFQDRNDPLSFFEVVRSAHYLSLIGCWLSRLSELNSISIRLVFSFKLEPRPGSTGFANIPEEGQGSKTMVDGLTDLTGRICGVGIATTRDSRDHCRSPSASPMYACLFSRYDDCPGIEREGH
jgi:hypothetical protein